MKIPLYCLLLFAACHKEPVLPDPSPYLPASVMASDTGRYFYLIEEGNPAYPPTYHYGYSRLKIASDTTLLMGGYRLYPLTKTTGLVGRHFTSGYLSTGSGYYYSIGGYAEGEYKIANGALVFNLTKHLENGTQQFESRSFYCAKPSAAALTRADYLGTYKGASVDFEGRGNRMTLTIEADSSDRGVVLKELKRKGYIDPAGRLVLPKAPVPYAAPGEDLFFTESIASLECRALVINTQVVHPSPYPGGYRGYALVK